MIIIFHTIVKKNLKVVGSNTYKNEKQLNYRDNSLALWKGSRVSPGSTDRCGTN